MVPVAIAQLPTMGSIKWKWLYSGPLGNSSKWLRHGIISTAGVYIDGIQFETEIRRPTWNWNSEMLGHYLSWGNTAIMLLGDRL